MLEAESAPEAGLTKFTGSPSGDRISISKLSLLILLCIAFVAPRLYFILYVPRILHPDEIFQYIEQANRILTGQGLLPWEYQIGSRSYLLAFVVLPALAIRNWLTPDFGDPVIAARIMMCLLWCVPLVLNFLYLAKRMGQIGASIAIFVLCISFESLLYSPHVLAENLAAICLASALPLLSDMNISARKRHLRAGLVLLALMVVFRIQLMPVALVFVIILTILHRKSFSRVEYGVFALPFLLSGLVDYAMWGELFRSTIENIKINLILDGADYFGKEPLYFYAIEEAAIWGTYKFIIPIMALIGFYRFPFYTLAAALILIPHSFIDHKELRFIWPALMLVIMMAGVGSFILIEKMIKTRPRFSAIALVLMVTFWGKVTIDLSVDHNLRDYMLIGRASFLAAQKINQNKAICGVAIHPSDQWLYFPGHSFFNRKMPLYDGGAEKLQSLPDFNAILVRGAATPQIPLYQLQECWDEPGSKNFGRLCLWKREGVCTDQGGALHEAKTDPVFRGFLERNGYPGVK